MKRRTSGPTWRKRAVLPWNNETEPAAPLVPAGLLLRFAAGVTAPAGILVVGAGRRTTLLPLYVNGRFLTGTGRTAASGLHIFFHGCHINLHETHGLADVFARSVPWRWISQRASIEKVDADAPRCHQLCLGSRLTGTFPPAVRASDRPIAIARFRLRTRVPELQN